MFSIGSYAEVATMNALERLLQEDLNHLLDRIAAEAGEGTAASCLASRGDIAAQLNEAEARLSNTRRGLLEGYAAWHAALKECSDLWALATSGSAVSDASERRAA
jgi:hypothetical protein